MKFFILRIALYKKAEFSDRFSQVILSDQLSYFIRRYFYFYHFLPV